MTIICRSGWGVQNLGKPAYIILARSLICILFTPHMFRGGVDYKIILSFPAQNTDLWIRFLFQLGVDRFCEVNNIPIPIFSSNRNNIPIFIKLPILTWGVGESLYPPILKPSTKAFDIKHSLRPLGSLFFCKNKGFDHILVSIYELKILIKNPLDQFIIYRFIPIHILILTNSWDF